MSCDDHDDSQAPAEHLWQVTEMRWAALAGLLLLASFIASFTDHNAVSTVIAMLSAATGGWTFVPGTIRKLRKRRVGVDTLMTIAGIGAICLGEFREAAMLAVLFSISEGLEEFSLAKARHGLRALLSLLPETAVVVRDGTEQEIPASDVRIGETLIVRSGNRIATDGIIRKGRSAVDMSAITGESIPVEVYEGVHVFAGSINATGVLQVEATATTTDNSLSRVVHIVEEAQARKGQGQRLADRIATPLVPGVLIAALIIVALGALFGDANLWLHRALVVLVAASPCALAIAVPITVVAAIGGASRFGVIIKGGAALEVLGTIKVIALDKTGTLTRNQPSVVEVVAIPGTETAEVLRLAAALEARSEHPLAAAIVMAQKDVTPSEDVEAVTGAGITGTVDGMTVRLGRPGWLDVGVLATDVERLQSAGATTVLVERNGIIIGAIAVRDDIRPEAREVVSMLHKHGRSVAMLTGDNNKTATAIAKEAGIATVHADLRPEDKAQLIENLRTKGPVAMVGDGVNDAPALAVSDIGIAMGAMGSDVAIETADVALMGQDLRALPMILDHAARARHIMLQNVGLSLLIVVALLPLAFFGVLGLATVVAVHEVAEVLVISNGIRAGRFEQTYRDPSLHKPGERHDIQDGALM